MAKSLVFVVTGCKSNGKENACLQAWSSFVGSGADHFVCILGKVNKGGHMYQSLKKKNVECFLNIECEFLWEHEHYEGSPEVTVALINQLIRKQEKQQRLVPES